MSLVEILKPAQTAILRLVASSPQTDIVRTSTGLTFKLLYTTFVLLLISSIVSTLKQFFGDPITCMVDGLGDRNSKFFNEYCWFQGTFTVDTDEMSYNQAIEPGVAQFGRLSYHGQKKVASQPLHKAYYQWIFFVLFFQAMMCLVPYKVWKHLQGRKLRHLESLAKLDEESVKVNNDKVASELFRNRNNQTSYTVSYFFCEILVLSTIVVQLVLMYWFFDGELGAYGAKVFHHFVIEGKGLKDDDTAYRQPMIKVFPRVTKCQLKTFVYTGGTQNHDGLCVLPLNVIHEKIYLFIWFWYLALIVIIMVYFIFLLVLVFNRNVRANLLLTKSPRTHMSTLRYIVCCLSLGDWLILWHMSRAMKPEPFGTVLEQVYTKLVDAESNEKNKSNVRHLS